VISPILRGIFGLEWDAASQTLTVTPHLPADWNSATVQHVPLGNATVDLSFTRRGQQLIVDVDGGTGVRLASHTPGARLQGSSLQIPLPAVEVGIHQHLPEFGAETRQTKVLDEQYSSRSLTLTLAAQGSATRTVYVKENAPGLHLQTADANLGAAEDGMRPVTVQFPAADGYVTKTVTFRW